MGDSIALDRATIVTYSDEFAKQEIVELAKAAGYSVQAVITQKQVVKSEYGVGVGKAQELQQLVAENESKTIIIDESLSSSQANRLATVTQAEVVDRERLILNIFARRASTAEAKLQVELAELRYEIPRARDAVKYSVKGERDHEAPEAPLTLDQSRSLFFLLEQLLSELLESLDAPNLDPMLCRKSVLLGRSAFSSNEWNPGRKSVE